MSEPTPEQIAQAQQQMAQEQHRRDLNQIVEQGRVDYGTQTFDDAAQVVAGELGDRTGEFMAVAKEFDDPAAIVVHLANNVDRARQLAKLPTRRMIAEIGRIEAQQKPYGYATTGADPLWRNPNMRVGKISDEDWSRTGGDHLDDRNWNKEFDRRMAARGGKPHVSTEAQRWAERVRGGGR